MNVLIGRYQVQAAHKIWNFFKLTRPLFLVGGVQLYFLGAFAALAGGASINFAHLLLGQLMITSIQLMTQYSNEYYDLEGDRLNQRRTWFSGGSGVLAAGTLSPRTAWRAAVFFGGLGLVMIILAGWQIPAVVPLGLAGLAAAWSYSGPPLALVRTGWGELSASLVVAFMVPVVGYMMQSGGSVNLTILLVCIPLVLIHFAMLIAFQIPDYEADALSHKHTLAVRLGVSPAAKLHNAALIAAFCISLGLALAGWPGSQLAWVTLPLAGWQIWRIRHYLVDGITQFRGLTMGALSLFALTTGLWLAGFIILWVQAL